jgi:hypothetical protein
MSEKEIIYKKLQKLLEYKDKLNYYYNKTEELFGCSIDQGLFDVVYRIFEEYCECLEKSLIGTDKYYVIQWYIYDNSCGSEELSWEINERIYTICNINDLVDLILVLREEESDNSFFTESTVDNQLLYNVCMNYRHDFGLLDDVERERYKDIALAWKNAWDKELKQI